MKNDETTAEHPAWLKIMLHVNSGLLAFVFLGAGFVKLVGFQFVIDDFEHWEYPTWFRYLSGLVEVAGAVLIVIPRTRYYGSLTIICVLFGAIITHWKAGEGSEAIFPLILLIMACIVWWFVRPHPTTTAAADDTAKAEKEAKSA